MQSAEKMLRTSFFDTNGIAGFVFYGAIVAVVFLFMTGHAIPATGVLVVMFLIPLILIGFKEPLGKLVEKKADAMPKEKRHVPCNCIFRTV